MAESVSCPGWDEAIQWRDDAKSCRDEYENSPVVLLVSRRRRDDDSDRQIVEDECGTPEWLLKRMSLMESEARVVVIWDQRRFSDR